MDTGADGASAGAGRTHRWLWLGHEEGTQVPPRPQGQLSDRGSQHPGNPQAGGSQACDFTGRQVAMGLFPRRGGGDISSPQSGGPRAAEERLRPCGETLLPPPSALSEDGWPSGDSTGS